MADVSLILGESGSGKSRSLQNLPAKNTFVVNVVGKQKRLPFKGSGSAYTEFNMETGEGNMLTSRDWVTIAKVLKYVNKNRPEIRFIVLDDNQYLSLFTYTSRINEKDWAKFNTITVNTVDMVDLLGGLRDNIMVFILQHIENGASVEGKELIQAKTLGKFIKEKLTYEGLFTTVLLCDKEEKDNGTIEHFFWTRRINSTVKSPEGMFEEAKIPNDLWKVAKAIHHFYE
jgi:hypothetical protein